MNENKWFMPLENVVKGRIAENLVNELLRRDGYHVYRFGYETVLQNLTQIEGDILRGNSDIVRQIRSIPDFLCVKSGKPIFIEVKFRSRLHLNLDKNFNEDLDIIKQLDRINQFWKAKVIFVTTEEPYFRISNPPYYDDKLILNYMRIEEDKELEIKIDILSEFNDLVIRYLKETKNNKSR